METGVSASDEQVIDLAREGAGHLGKAQNELREVSALILDAAKETLKDLSTKSVNNPVVAQQKSAIQMALFDVQPTLTSTRRPSRSASSILAPALLTVASHISNESPSDRILKQDIQTRHQREQLSKITTLADALSAANPKFDRNAIRIKEASIRDNLDKADAYGALAKQGSTIFLYSGSLHFNPSNNGRSVLGLYQASSDDRTYTMGEIYKRKALFQSPNGPKILTREVSDQILSAPSPSLAKDNWAQTALKQNPQARPKAPSPFPGLDFKPPGSSPF